MTRSGVPERTNRPVSVLEVDLRRFEQLGKSERAAAVDGTRQSLASGFVYLRHDLSAELLDACYADLEQFFSQPLAAKQDVHVPGARGQRGYTGRGIETAATAEQPDWKEMLNWGETAPAGHPLGQKFPDHYLAPVFPEAAVPGISKRLMTFHRELLELQRRFLRIVAVALGAHERYFDSMTRHGATLTRAAYYPSMSEAPKDGRVWAAPHGDINLITALPRATARGLQMQTADGWIDAEPPEGCAILNTGMMLEHISNGQLPAGIHRVVADPEQVGARIAVVQFCHPTPTTILAPLASCISPAHPEAYPAVSAADRLDEVLWEINLGD